MTKIDEISQDLIDTRDALAYRKLRGDPLDEHETAILESLNRLLDAALPAPTPLPAEIQALVEEILASSKPTR